MRSSTISSTGFRSPNRPTIPYRQLSESSKNKGFVSHKAYGRTYEYYPVIVKEEYTRNYMNTVLNNFFDGSVSSLVNFFSSNRSITVEEADEILRILNSGR